MTQPVISVILPAYNASQTLARAICSVREQTFQNWELIVVDDGSKDDTLQIAEEFAQVDKRIHVVTQDNGGRSRARNTGLVNSNGMYIAFFDADDYFFTNSLFDLLDSAKKYKSDLVIGEIVSSHHRSILKNSFFEEIQAIEYLFALKKNQRLFNSLWNKLFKREIVTRYQLQFPVGIEMGEDTIFVLSYILHLHTLSTISNPVCNYFPQKNSITRRPFSIDYVDRKHMAHLLWVDIFKKWHLPVQRVYRSFFTMRMFGCSRMAKDNPSLLKELIQQTFNDPYILDFAKQIQNTCYDNFFAVLIREKHARIWTLCAKFIAIFRKIIGR